MSDEMLVSLRTDLARLASCLPREVDLLAVHNRYKAPSKVLMLRESLIWREEELGRNALKALDDGNFVTAALLTRAVMETTAALVFLDSLVVRAIDKGVSAGLEEKLTGFLTGSRVWEDIGGAIHVNDMLREVQKIIPGFFDQHYAMLCEIAHPNWSGNLGAFGVINKDAMKVKFVRGGRSPNTQRNIILANLAGSIGLFVGYYNMLADKIPEFTKAIESFYESGKAATPTNASGLSESGE